MSKKLYRSPVVVVLGHVDHGKTTLLDAIRKSNLTEKEVGSITQSIGAYQVDTHIKDYPSGKITFIDTPGHEAFVQMRVRGADVADVAILIVDAVDSIMPQTKESIFHIKNAGIPFLVAVNKMDLPGAHIDRVKKHLLKEGVLLEGMGGDVPVIPVSAKKGEGIQELLELILLLAHQKGLSYDPGADAKAYIIESQIGKGGAVASAVIKNGVLKVGDTVFSGKLEAKVRALLDEYGKKMEKVEPSTPFQILGFKDLPEIGLLSTVPTDVSASDTKDEKAAEDPLAFLKTEEHKKLNIVLKTDSQGTLGAIEAALAKKENIAISLSGVGEVSKSDIFLAKISKAVVVSFNAAVSKNIEDLAEREKVIIKTYSLIYRLIEELEEVSQVLTESEQKSKSLKGEAKVLATFVIEDEKIAGVKMMKGKFSLKDSVEVLRNDKVVADGNIVSLKQRAENAVELKKGGEGGVLIEPQFDIHIGDVIKSYSI